MLHERLLRVVPAFRHDPAVDLVALLPPAVELGGPALIERHPDGTVEGHPPHEPAVREGLATTPRLPDPLVGLVPVLAQPVDHAHDVLPAAIADGRMHTVHEADRVHRLAE